MKENERKRSTGRIEHILNSKVHFPALGISRDVAATDFLCDTIFPLSFQDVRSHLSQTDVCIREEECCIPGVTTPSGFTPNVS